MIPFVRALILCLAAGSVAAAPTRGGINRAAADAVYDSPEYAKWVEMAKPGDVYRYTGGAITKGSDEIVPADQVPGGPAQAPASNTTGNSTGNSTGNFTLEARRECQYRKDSLQTNIDASGLWWDAWFRMMERCERCDQDQCYVPFDWTWTSEWRISGNFDHAGAQAAEDTINGDGNINQGLQWGRAFSTGSKYVCAPSRGSPVSLWRQNHVGWTDIAQRDVYKSTTCPGLKPSYGDWKFSHIDWAIARDIDEGYKLGCSYWESSQC